MDRESHWNRVYETRQPDTVSWYERSPERSLAYIRKFAGLSQKVIDVGAGASLLVDTLLDVGFERPVALDVSAAGLDHAKARLGARAKLVEWVVADITKNPSLPAVDLWHDRAVLHFLTAASDQFDYSQLAKKTVRPGGHLVIATFAPDGPETCSGLPVQRHDGASLSKLLGIDFELMEADREAHITPSGTEQGFTWAVFQRRLFELRLPRRSSFPASPLPPVEQSL
jgi:SAM-dependent methyltransferase